MANWWKLFCDWCAPGTLYLGPKGGRNNASSSTSESESESESKSELKSESESKSDSCLLAKYVSTMNSVSADGDL